MPEPTTCPICSAASVRIQFPLRGHDICRCLVCDHLWAHGGVTVDYAHGASLLEHFKSVEGVHRALMRKNLRFLKRYLTPGGRILDFGCGSGFFVLEARRQGYDAVGLDVAEWVKEAAAHWGLPLDVCRLEDAPYRRQSFDAVISIVSFEHLAEPAEVLPRLAELLRPGGILAILSIPHSRGLPWRLLEKRWWDLDPPSHLHFFSRRSIRALLERNGLRVLTLRTTGVGTGFFTGLLGKSRDEKTILDAFQQQVNTGEVLEGSGGGARIRQVATCVAVPAMNWCLHVTRLGNNLTVVARKERW